MASTDTDVVNIAFRRVGAARLTSLNGDTSKEAIVARDLYPEARRNVLNLHNWNFAIKRAQLTASATEPTFGWDYAYPLPEDFVRMVSVHPHDDDDASVPYRLEYQDGDDRVLVTNSNQIYVRYVFDCDDVNVWSAAFRDVMAFMLARDLGAALGLSSSRAELTDRAFRSMLARAKAIDGVEDWPEEMAEGSWVTSRHPDVSRA